MPLNNYQISYNGLTMGDGTVYDINRIEGTHDLATRITDRDFPRAHGQIPSRNLATYRIIELDIEVIGTAGTAQLADDLNALMDAFSPTRDGDADDTADVFAWKLKGEDEMFTYARPIRRSMLRRGSTERGRIPVTIQLRAYDPRRYVADTGGARFTSGTKTQAQAPFNVTNNGLADAYPIFTCTPKANQTLTIVNNTTGVTIDFTNVGTAAAFIIDFERWVRGRWDLLMVYRGTTDHYGDWTAPRNPLYLAPGVNNIDLTNGVDIKVDWYDTWL